MTAYVANHEKKNRIFAKRERELLHAIKHGLPTERLLVVAEKLRAAKIRVFKCRFTKNSEVPPRSFWAEQAASHDRQLQLWLAMSADDIVETYRPKVSFR